MKSRPYPDPASPPAPDLLRRALIGTPLLANACTAPLTAPRQQAIALSLPGRPTPLQALLALPRGYHDDERAWPLVVFLHGSGERGDDIERVKVNGPPRLVAEGREFPFVLCSPQLEAEGDWNPDQLHALLAALRSGWRIDATRTTATGLSRGGHGVWRWAAAWPDDLAGIAPVCGHGDPARVCRARRVPVRAYHGADDNVVPLAAQQACVDALRACGGEVSFTVYPGVGHGSWEAAYEDPGLVPWLMARRRT